MEDNFNLIEFDAGEIFKEALELHENMTGVRLATGDETTFIYSTVSVLLANIKAEMNAVAKGNYLKYSEDKRLDLKGNLYGERGKRLEANSARTTMRCYISTSLGRDVVIPKGTRFIKDSYIFKSETESVIKSGNLSADVMVVSETPGKLPTILTGEIKSIVDRYDYYEKCENITQVTGGSDIESDESYRERIREIPESFTTAGSEDSYKFWTKKASSLIKDVSVSSPSVNVVNICVLGEEGDLSQEEIHKIENFISAKDRRPLGDFVTVFNPQHVDFSIDLDYYTYSEKNMDIRELNLTIQDKLEEFTKNFSIGESINTQDIIQILKELGVKRVVVKSPQDTVIANNQIAVCRNISFGFQGSENS